MKKSLNTILIIFLFTGIFKNSRAQVMKTDKEIFSVEGAYNFIILKKDIKTQKVLSKVETKIPDKSQKEMFYPGSNFANFELIGENIVIVYDVWQKETGTKDCSIKTLNIKTNKFSQAKLVYSTKVNSVYSSNEIIYKPIYSPDKSKLAILKDNISPSYDIDPEITIYDTKSFSILSTKKLSSKFEGQKRVINQNYTLDNEGNIALTFSLLNEKTKITTKSYSAEIPLKDTDMKNIKEVVEGVATNDDGVDQKAHGRFYKNLQDYADNKFIAGYRVKNKTYYYVAFSGETFDLIDDKGELKQTKVSDFPSELFSYKSSDFSNFYLIRSYKGKAYIFLYAGKLCYYAEYGNQAIRFYSEGTDGELKKFKESILEKYLKENGLFEDYRKDKPKREMKDDVNDYFNKTISWQIKYFELLNTKM